MRPQPADAARFIWTLLILIGVCLIGYFALGWLADHFL